MNCSEVVLKVQLKPCTSIEWIWSRILNLGVGHLAQSLIDINEADDTTTFVTIPEEDEIRISRAIRMISPEVIDVSRAA